MENAVVNVGTLPAGSPTSVLGVAASGAAVLLPASKIAQTANNLNDLADKAAARGNLGLGSVATMNVPGTPAAQASATQVVRGDDPRLLAATTVGQSLVTATDAAVARSALGLGSAAILSVPGTAGAVASANQAVRGDDPRLNDARMPTAHQHTAAQISDVTTVGKTLMTAADAAVARSAIGAAQTVSGSYGFRNKIINGCFRIDQRVLGAYNPAAEAVLYTQDRWNFYVSQTSKLYTEHNQGGVTPPPGFAHYLGVASSSSYSPASGELFVLQQRIEGNNVADLAFGTASAKPVTLSFYVRTSIAGVYAGAITNGAVNRSCPFTFNVASANTWQWVTVTIPGDTSGSWATDTSIGLTVTFSLGVGSSYKGLSGAWNAGNFVSVAGAVDLVGTNGATFFITGVQLELGSVATPFELRQDSFELSLCQFYFRKPIGQYGILLGIAGYSNVVSVNVTGRMRTTPTCVLYNLIADYRTGFTSVTSVNGLAMHADGVFINLNVTGITVGAVFQLQASGSAGYLTLNSEL